MLLADLFWAGLSESIPTRLGFFAPPARFAPRACFVRPERLKPRAPAAAVPTGATGAREPVAFWLGSGVGFATQPDATAVASVRAHPTCCASRQRGSLDAQHGLPCAEVAAHCGVAHRKPQDLWQQIASSNRTLETPSSHQPAPPEPKHHPAATAATTVLNMATPSYETRP